MTEKTLAGLAKSLNNQIIHVSALGQSADAEMASREAVSVHRPPVRERPEVFRANLASSRNNPAERLTSLGQNDPALAAFAEADSFYRELVRTRPTCSPTSSGARKRRASCFALVRARPRPR